MRILLSLILVGGAWAQQPPPQPAKPKRIPEPKNLKILKVPPTELIPLMRAYSASLGVMCTHCHVKGDFASDENPKKETARMMIAMSEEINAKFHSEKQHVSCFTCHRGEVEPKVDAPAAPPPPPPPPPQP